MDFFKLGNGEFECVSVDFFGVFGDFEFCGCICGESSSGGVTSPPGFYDELYKDGYFDSIDPILKKLYEDFERDCVKGFSFGCMEDRQSDVSLPKNSIHGSGYPNTPTSIEHLGSIIMMKFEILIYGFLALIAFSL
ncbi:hypothetical protein CQW23_16993 [Capsicum baccatum]|uniref:Uncharacterized protein n=1 Tax=Capsicum baccatum TaxID=33114 RepID=A0A2G2WCL5_CAPBA|nr:hypothetical protein CQW23_16993 [Capsicum baccatum]